MAEPIVKSPRFYRPIFQSNLKRQIKEAERKRIETVNYWLKLIDRKLSRVGSKDGKDICLKFRKYSLDTYPIDMDLLREKLEESGWKCVTYKLYGPLNNEAAHLKWILLDAIESLE